MKKLSGVFIVLSMILAVGIVFAGTAGTKATTGTVVAPPAQSITLQPIKPCCIAGKYQGSNQDNLPASKTCPTPQSGKFTMEINQDKACDSKISGTITHLKDGSVDKFEGTVKSRGPCCYIEGVVKGPLMPTGAPGNYTKFQGTLCKKGGKFEGSGTYTHYKAGVAECSGKWEMKQM